MRKSITGSEILLNSSIKKGRKRGKGKKVVASKKVIEKEFLRKKGSDK